MKLLILLLTLCFSGCVIIQDSQNNKTNVVLFGSGALDKVQDKPK